MSATGSSDELCAQHGDQPFSNCWRFHAENPEDCCDDLTPGPSPSGGEDRSRSVSPYLPASGPDQRIDGAADQPPPKKKSRGKQKIKIEFIQDKNRRFTTFSKRKTGLMKKAYELASLTGAHVLLLVASETGHVYTYTTEKLNNMVQSNNGKALIQACLSSEKSPDGGGSGGGMMPSPGEAASPVGAGSGAPRLLCQRSPRRHRRRRRLSFHFSSRIRRLSRLCSTISSSTFSITCSHRRRPRSIRWLNSSNKLSLLCLSITSSII
uniref:MADS-box domain-containing protein n=1 Tax=Macrostomum lignano TaxID=282301 RepID=A0A1I8GU23_9PLAT